VFRFDFLFGYYDTLYTTVMFTKTLLLALFPSIAVAAPHQRHYAGANQGQHQGGMSCMPQQNAGNPAVGKAIYILTNDAENAVVALPIGADGLLSKGKVMKTGGAGSVAVDAEGNPATPDALLSQSALTIAGNVSSFESIENMERTYG
jgi:hypothetical protein